jgi:branched-chain amino acid transport system ATP-binding protein
MGEAVLTTRGLVKRFGALVATSQINFDLRAGERHALIGPNGAGKTTFVGLLSGTLRPDGGTITLIGREITHERPDRRVKAGLVRTFQISSLFRSLSVLENVYLAASEHLGAARHMLRPAAHHRDVMQRAEEVIRALGLDDDMHHRISEKPTVGSGWWKSHWHCAWSQKFWCSTSQPLEFPLAKPLSCSM